MKNLKILLIIIFFVISGCTSIKDETTTLKSYITNSTLSAKITILFYKTGFVSSKDTLKILPGETIQFGDGWEFGDIKVPMFESEHLGGPEDSVVVIFNDSFSVTHYANTPTDLSSKYYLFESLRNINNPLSYEFETVRIKKERINYHYYTFTESDYEFAKD